MLSGNEELIITARRYEEVSREVDKFTSEINRDNKSLPSFKEVMNLIIKTKQLHTTK